jgi:hypothetical protein
MGKTKMDDYFSLESILLLAKIEVETKELELTI